MTVQLSDEQVVDYWCAANYLAAAQIYLRDNVLLREPLQPEHFKPRLLGHWGTVPGINLVYAHLNRLIRKRDAPVLLITGPGHGAPANLANLYLEGSLGERYSRYRRGMEGLKHLVQDFSWPGGFPSHLTPATPGTIHEGGELGYALATAFGAAFDSPDLTVACLVGDGEAETGPTATAWHSIKYLHPVRDGSVLPILHLNHYKIASRTVFGAMSEKELRALFSGYGYDPIFIAIDAHDPWHESHKRMALGMLSAFDRIDERREAARADTGGNGIAARLPRSPVIILRSPKGWTTVDSFQGEAIEESWRSHQVPLTEPRTNASQRDAVERWLRSYEPDRLFDDAGQPSGNWIDVAPEGDRRMGMVPQSNGGTVRRPLKRPDWRSLGVAIQPERRGAVTSSDTRVCGTLLREVVQRNSCCFRIVCPDEMDSNRLSDVFETTSRQFVWPLDDRDLHIGESGQVLEMLSEHTCQAWLQGYLLTGRHGLFPSYEAFVSIVDSMMGQYAKFLKRSSEIEWREKISSFNYLLTSEGWRQEHNGYSHQMPGFINTLLNKKAQNVRIYLPPDTNCLLSTMDHCLDSTDKINLIIASKQPMPQWLSVEEAASHCERGMSIWNWFGDDSNDNAPDVVLACAGVYPTAEAVMAAKFLANDLPECRLRFVNVTDLLILESDSYHPHGLTDERFKQYFGDQCPVIFSFHGYPSAIKQLLWNRPHHNRFSIHGYREEGATTTPFTLLAVNGVDRFSLVDDILEALINAGVAYADQAKKLRQSYRDTQSCWLRFAEQEGQDVEEFEDWAV